jgi:hypothetical protein
LANNFGVGQNRPSLLEILFAQQPILEAVEDLFEPVLSVHRPHSRTLTPIYFICPYLKSVAKRKLFFCRRDIEGDDICPPCVPQVTPMPCTVSSNPSVVGIIYNNLFSLTYQVSSVSLASLIHIHCFPINRKHSNLQFTNINL